VTTNPADMTEPAASEPEWVWDAAGQLFGERLPLAEEYARLLSTEGVVRGLVGPRETSRIWERHLLNCAVVAELIPSGVHVVDVGSGAGLPGIVLALARPDLTVTLVEPMQRRTTYLSEVVTELSLAATVTVLQARAEEAAGRLPPAEVVTARALARLDRLAAWCLPLAALGGRVLAIKGESAPDEVAEYSDVVTQLGGAEPVVHRCGGGLLPQPTTVVEIVREREVAPRAAALPRRKGRSRRR
jgi:16S rRNA (guanine527-N7)-methyltransferase